MRKIFYAFCLVIVVLTSCRKTDQDVFDCNVNISFKESAVDVTCDDPFILFFTDGAHLAINLTSGKSTNTLITLSGKTSDGSLKVYSKERFTIMLNGVDITSHRGPAINSQSDKRMEIILAKGSTNNLTDCKKYQEDCYYQNPGNADEEDRKGCLFSEGNILIRGYGSLGINACHKHAIHSDGSILIEENPSIYINGAKSNGISANGHKSEGITINGGNIFASLSNAGGKCIKSDGIIRINGGSFDLCSSADGYFDYEKADKIYSSCIKSDTSIFITGGDIKASCSGWGGKVIRSKRDIRISGGNLEIKTEKPQAEGIESKMAAKNALVIDGGDLILDCYKNCLNSNGQIVINGGNIYAISHGNDAVDSNFDEPGAVTINGGNTLAFCAFGSPQEGIDTEGQPIAITGGTTFSIGGAQVDLPPMPVEKKSTQYTACLTELDFSEGQMIEIRIKGENRSLWSVKAPFSMRNDYSVISLPEFRKNVNYEVYIGDVLVKSFSFSSSRTVVI